MADMSAASLRVDCSLLVAFLPSSASRSNLSSAFNKASIFPSVTESSYQKVSRGYSILGYTGSCLIPRAMSRAFRRCAYTTRETVNPDEMEEIREDQAYS